MKTLARKSPFRTPLHAAIVLLTAASMLASGCISPRQWIANRGKVGPNYARPGAAVASQWLDGSDPRVKREQLKNFRWWQVFGDSILNSLVQSAYEQNLSLKEASFRVLESRLQLAIAAGNLLPQQQQAFGDYARSMSSRRTTMGGLIPNRYMGSWDMGFNLAWELDLWGKYRRAIESAGADYEASIEDYDAVLVTLISDVAATYAEIRTLEQQIALAAQNVELQKKTLELTQIRFDGGATGKLDVVQAEANVAQTESLIPPLDISLRQAQNRLCILLGLPTEDIAKRIGAGPIPPTPVEAAVGIPADLLARRPDIRGAERRLAAQSALIGVSTAQLYPQIAITGTIGLESQRLKDLFNSNSAMGSIGPSLRWDILNYGRNLNRIRIADAEFQALILAYRNTVLRANQEVEDGLAAFLGSQQLVRSLARSVKADEESVELVVFQYREGKVDFNRVFTTQRELVQQQNQLAQAQGGVVQGLVQVYRALGGGWEINCPDRNADSAQGIETPLSNENVAVPPKTYDLLDLPAKPSEESPATTPETKLGDKPAVPARQPGKPAAKNPLKDPITPFELDTLLPDDDPPLVLPKSTDAAPSEAVPNTMPKDPVPKDLVPKDLVPKDLVPKDLVPKDLVPKDLVPKDLVPKDPAPLAPEMLDPDLIQPDTTLPKRLAPSDLDAPRAPLPK